MDNHQTMRKGILAAKAGNSILARLHLQEAVEVDPDNADSWLWLAWVAESPASAQIFLERVLELDPQNEAAQTGLSWTRCLVDFQVLEHTEGSSDSLVADDDLDHAEPTKDAFVSSAGEFTESGPLTEEGSTTDSQCATESDEFVAEEPAETSESVESDELLAEDPVDSNEDESHADSPVAETEDIASKPVCDTEVCAALPADEESVCPIDATLYGGFADEYCVQEAIVASVDEQLESLFASEQLLDQLESFDTVTNEQLNEDPEESVPQPDLETSSEVEDFEEADVVSKSDTEPAPDAALELTIDDAADRAPQQSGLESSETEQTEVGSEVDTQPTGTLEEVPTCGAEEPSSCDELEQPLDVAHEEPASDDDGRPVIVICDDSPTVRKLVCMSLEPHGFRVLTAVNGVEGSALIQQVVPNLVLSDINMPEMDGYQLCKSVTKNPLTQHIPVVMLSGKDGLFDKLRGKLVGSTDHMSKPFSPRDLLRVVRNYLESCSAWSS